MNQRRHTYKDPTGHIFTIEVNSDPPYLNVYAFWKGFPVAYAYLSQGENVSAILQDIKIQDAPLTWYQGWRWAEQVIFVRSFRRRGVGKRMLEIALQELRELGIKRVTGRMDQPSPWLINWYRGAGFEVANNGADISISL